jgi:hypothetical protein
MCVPSPETEMVCHGCDGAVVIDHVAPELVET